MTDTVTVAPRPEPTRWRARVTALAIDLLPGLAVMASVGVLALCFPSGSVGRWTATGIAGLAFLATAAGRFLLPTVTGWSLGRAVAGIDGVRGDSAGKPPPPANVRGAAAAVFVTAAAVSLVAAATAYFAVYQNDHRSDRAKAEIARQGPKIVADMLSYDPETLQADFDRAQSLATEKYRQQLVPQQDAIRDAKPVPNFYRVTDGAVVNAAPDRATMLLFLQGQRGTPGKERLISATVEVAFVQTSGTWRVDNLDVVSKPLPAEGDR
ncbi:hypothetical protein [Mycolicibacter icosiumassiliensis]|uniref:hypothetical protein n=1 Tax=Mycolicibacter icosiumassiliensis TaxID=1792835 RepID=UPI0008311842|nr:hypothetical protein [Mycolicibacter icosiumassiliensis]